MKPIKYILLTVMAFSCSQATGNEDEAVRRTMVGIIEADNEGNIGRVLSYYAEDAVLVPPGRPEITGIADIRNNYQNIFAASVLRLDIKIDSIFIAEKLAVGYGLTYGDVVSKNDSAIKTVNDRFMMLLQRDDSSWRITRLMWSPR